MNTDVFGDNINNDENIIPFEEAPEIKSTGLRGDISPTVEPLRKDTSYTAFNEPKEDMSFADKFNKLKQERDKLNVEEQKINQYNKQLVDDYQNLKAKFESSPDEKMTDDEWNEFIRLAKAANYSMKKIVMCGG